MILSHTLRLFLLVLISMATLQAQKTFTPQERSRIEETAKKIKAQEKADAAEVDAYIQKTGVPRYVENADGTFYALRRIVDGQPRYDMTYNRQAAISTGTNHVQEGGRSGFNLKGADMIIGEWDGGGTLTSHVEFEGRALQRDAPFRPSNHATHVAGTLIAAGINPEAKGMAPKATLWAHDWNSDGSEMAQEAGQGLLISNHSYGTIAGWARGDWSEEGNTRWHWWGDVAIDSLEDYKFGYYDQRTASWDRIAHDAPYYLIVKSAGNNGNDNYSGSHVVRINGEWVESNDPRRVGDANGFDCLPTYSTAKNILTIGATRNVNGGYSGPSSVNITGFSSRGPTDDGRIKPDIVGDGSGLLSANNSSNTAYGRSSGTSMSGPNVAGSILLLQELHREMTGEFMRSSSLKGLVLHTADDAGNPGPDYTYGWGLLNTESAAEILAQPLRHPFVETNLNPKDTFTYSIISDGETPVRATLCWTDPAAQVRPPALNDRTPRLINDLDLRVIALSGSDSGTVYRPFTLDPENPGADAQTGDNFRDNVEMIDAGILPSGDYLVQVTHKDELQDNSPQDFSLWLSAPVSDCAFTLRVDSLQGPLCPDSDDSFVELSTEGAVGETTFWVDAENRGTDSLIQPVRTGKIYLSAIDSTGCYASTDVVIDRPEGLSFGDFDRVLGRIYSPRPERKEFTISNSFSSGWGADPNDNWWRARAFAGDDGTADAILGCESYINDSLVSGNIAIVRRGECQFGTKALRAEEAGAVACIIINSEAGVIPMAPGDDGNQVSIPVFMISKSDGDDLIDLMADTAVQLTLGRVQEIVSPECAGVDNGMINVYTEPKMEEVEFAWNTGDSTEVLRNLAPGSYSLTVTDVRNCTYEREFEIMAPDTVKVEFDRIERVSCPDTADGSAVVIPTGGEPPYQFAWASGEEGSTVDALDAGWNRVSVTDARGCLRIDSVEIPSAIEPGVDMKEVLPSCADTAVGTVVLKPRGTEPFSVLWADSATELQRENLAAGNHAFTLTDGCGRNISDSLQIELADDSLSIESNVIAADCYGEMGRIDFDLEGGRAPYQIEWSTGEETVTMGSGDFALPAGQYTASITDICGSDSGIDSFRIDEPKEIKLALADIQGESCPAAGDGSVSLTLSGGTGELEIVLEPEAPLDSLGGGRYLLRVFDENQCMRDTSFIIPSPDTLRSDFEVETDGTEVMFFDQSEAASDYFWDFGDGNTSTEPSPSHSYNEVGFYEVCLMVSNACGEEEFCQEIELFILSSDEPNRGELTFFPNPVRDRLQVALPRAKGRLQIWSSVGQLMADLPAQRRQTIRTSAWPSGVYLLRWQGRSYRLVKQ